jgi:hypothetical protein
VKRIQPVDNYLQIIRLFSIENERTGLGSNEVLRLTGKTDKQRVYRDLKVLTNANILHSKKNRHTGYKQPKFLTETGKKIKRFAEELDQYRRSCSAFRKKMIEIPMILYEDDETVSKERLQNLINIDDIDVKKLRNDYVEFMTKTSFLAYPTAMIDNILLRFSMLLTELPEKIAKDILSQIVIKGITNELYEMAHDSVNSALRKSISPESEFKSGDSSLNRLGQTLFPLTYQAGHIYGETSSDIWNRIVGHSIRTDILDFSYLREEFKDMAKMTLRILRPDDANAQSRIDFLRGTIQDLKSERKDKEANHSEIIASVCEEAYFGACDMTTDTKYG